MSCVNRTISAGMMDALTALLVTPALPELVKLLSNDYFSIICPTPTQVACLQKNSTLVLRNTLTGEAVCEMQLPACSSFQPHTLCFASSGNVVIFIGKDIF